LDKVMEGIMFPQFQVILFDLKIHYLIFRDME